MAQTELWIRLENEESPYIYALDVGMTYLADLATKICQTELKKNVQPGNLQFFLDYSKTVETGATLPVDIQFVHLKTSAEAPLIVRYLLSDVRVHIRFNLSGLKGSVTLPHSTGLYRLLQQRVYTEFELLRDGDPEFYFFQQLNNGEDGDNITNEFELNAIVEEGPTTSKRKEITLGIKIQGRKAYRDYKIKEVSELFVKDEWNSISNAPGFEPESLPVSPVNHSYAGYESFVNQLKDRYLAFGDRIRNATTAHQFISVFMVTAIRLLQKHDQKLQNLELLVEEPLNGTRGYGLVDYLVRYQQPIFILNEVRHDDIDEGAAQIIVQMHSALEKVSKKRKRDHAGYFAMFGIVTTAEKWVFLRWTGSLEEPVIQVSKVYNCSFTGQMENAMLVLSNIVRVLMSAIVGISPELEVVKALEPEFQLAKFISRKRTRITHS